MRLLMLLLCLSCCSLAQETFLFSSGDKQVYLLELYSSQGCSSCPPAQTWINQLQNAPTLWRQVIPVVFHVDYWNYLGWKDPFSKPQFSFRQRAHRRQGNVTSVYTPGFVVNGKEWRGWFRGQGLNLTETNAPELTIKLQNNRLGVMQFDAEFLSQSQPDSRSLKLNIALLAMNNNTQVLAGENRSRQLEESFIVIALFTFDAEGVINNSARGNHYAFSDVITVQSEVKALAAWVSEADSLHPIQSAGGYL